MVTARFNLIITSLHCEANGLNIDKLILIHESNWPTCPASLSGIPSNDKLSMKGFDLPSAAIDFTMMAVAVAVVFFALKLTG